MGTSSSYRVAMALLVASAASAGCTTREREHEREGEAASAPSNAPATPAASPEPHPAPAEAPTPTATVAARCADPVPVYDAGRRVGERCPDELAAEGLTLGDLSNGWAPSLFAEDPSLGASGRQPYREIFVALADEQRTTASGVEIAFERYLELYGVPPTLRVIAQRLANERHLACRDGVDDAALAELPAAIRPSLSSSEAARETRKLAYYVKVLEDAARRRGLDGVDALADDPEHARLYARYRARRAASAAVAAAQAHLVCESLLEEGAFEPGRLDAPTYEALRNFQRKHMIIARNGIDEETRAALVADPREMIFRQALRSLRERTVDAAGLLEDGSALGQFGTVLGRRLDPPDLELLADRPPLEGGAPDHVSPATEAVATALGVTGPVELRAFLDGLGDDALAAFRVAVRLPPPPPWQSPRMELTATIDRGDLSYDPPYTREGKPVGSRVRVRPTITLTAMHEGRAVPLVRWSTTIGGWQEELLPSGGVAMRYKVSPAGRRMWRDLVAAPAWLPPDTTPGEDLVRRVRGGYVANERLLGPSHASAYGLVLLVHHQPRSRRGVPLEPGDEGVRVHGSANYASIVRGTSHGCHRLFNHLAVRLAGYLLRHREHVRRGTIPASWSRTVRVNGESVRLSVRSRGYLYELTPPVPVEVLEGRVVSRRKTVPRGAFPLRRHLVAQAGAAPQPAN